VTHASRATFTAVSRAAVSDARVLCPEYAGRFGRGTFRAAVSANGVATCAAISAGAEITSFDRRNGAVRARVGIQQEPDDDRIAAIAAAAAIGETALAADAAVGVALIDIAAGGVATLADATLTGAAVGVATEAIATGAQTTRICMVNRVGKSAAAGRTVAGRSGTSYGVPGGIAAAAAAAITRAARTAIAAVAGSAAARATSGCATGNDAAYRRATLTAIAALGVAAGATVAGNHGVATEAGDCDVAFGVIR
jgi:hypothetical protein